mmetsp:Transcript_26404/g.41808  ORF Transcript_26404/g.41808 Transcript_26404/m.41808 type:complete len:377 (-) Transcript_26404:206-1336(-)
MYISNHKLAAMIMGAMGVVACLAFVSSSSASNSAMLASGVRARVASRVVPRIPVIPRGIRAQRIQAPRAGYNPVDEIKDGILSANQKVVYVSETQLKSAPLDGESPPVLTNVESLKLLSAIEESGLLKILDDNGLTLSYIENLGILSLTEKLGLLSALADPTSPTKIYSAALALSLVSAVGLGVLPSDNGIETLIKNLVVLGGSAGAVSAIVAARVLGTLQGQGYTKVGVDSGREELVNLAQKDTKVLKQPIDILANVEKQGLLSFVEKNKILSKLESSGISLSKIQDLKLLSTTEKAKVLSILSDTETPGKLSLAGLAGILAAAGLVAAVPDDDSTLVAAQAIGALLLGAPSVGALVGSNILGGLQKKPIKKMEN